MDALVSPQLSVEQALRGAVMSKQELSPPKKSVATKSETGNCQNSVVCVLLMCTKICVNPCLYIFVCIELRDIE